MNGMAMSPPPGGDPVGMAIAIVGAIVLIASFALGIYFSIQPGHRHAKHPMYTILRDDR